MNPIILNKIHEFQWQQSGEWLIVLGSTLFPFRCYSRTLSPFDVHSFTCLLLFNWGNLLPFPSVLYNCWVFDSAQILCCVETLHSGRSPFCVYCVCDGRQWSWDNGNGLAVLGSCLFLFRCHSRPISSFDIHALACVLLLKWDDLLPFPSLLYNC